MLQLTLHPLRPGTFCVQPVFVLFRRKPCHCCYCYSCLKHLVVMASALRRGLFDLFVCIPSQTSVLEREKKGVLCFVLLYCIVVCVVFALIYCIVVGAGIAQLVVLGLAVHSVAGSILLWGHFPVQGIFPWS